jgi:predicted HD superfamily hydrolase involved in NAD metabolism
MHPDLALFIRDITLNGDIQADMTALLAHHGCVKTIGHSMRVAAEAKRLAQHWQTDPRGAEIAGWLHDISAIVPADRRIWLAERLDLEILPEERALPLIIHQKLSASIAHDLFAIADPAVLGAIGCHTTLKANAGVLDKVLFVADKLKWDQFGDPPYLETMLGAAERSLDEAALCYLADLWRRREQIPVLHPWAQQAYHQLAGAMQ